MAIGRNTDAGRNIPTGHTVTHALRAGHAFAQKGIGFCDSSYLMKKYEDIKGTDVLYALIHFNIKNFRFYNLKYGMKSGDEILCLIFQCIDNFLDEDEYIGHLYADNFGILIKCEDGNQLIYGRMMEMIDKVYRIEDERIYRNLFASMGIYQITDSGVAFQDALNFANVSRKESSGLHKRSTCMELYDKTYYERYMGRMELESETADAYKNYEFVTFLQPKVDIKTQQIVGAEALIRWFDKEGNSIPLYKFLPILNQNGYIALLDIDTFEMICQWMEERLNKKQSVVPVSFNISGSYFYNPNLVKDYTTVFNKYHISADLVEIELMESISLNDTDQMKRIIAEFKKCGFSCALDDFGNGYSSFNVLLNAQLDTVKMDRQFFLNNLNGDGKLIIKTVVDLIHSLNMKVVAEGVESQEHIDYLKYCNCDYVQGYYYYKPMSVTEFEELLDAQTEKIWIEQSI